MAVNKFTGATNNNWGTATNWSLGTVPTATDGHIATFDATSPNCTVNTSTRPCNHIDFTNYTNTITMSFGIAVNGDCTLGASMNVVSSGPGIQFTFNGCNATSNGKVWPANFGSTTAASGSGGVVITLLDDWVVTGSLSFATSISSVGCTLNGYSLTFGGGLSLFGNGNRSLGGNTQLIANGTGTITSGVNSYCTPPLEINTSGTITFDTRFYKRTSLFKYTAGTTETNGCTFVFGSVALTVDVNGDTSPSATTLSSTGINFWRLDTTGGITTTLSSPIRIINLHTAGGGNFNSGANIYNKGDWTINSNTGSALYNYYLDGTGTWSGNAGVRHNLTINTSGTITISGNVRFGGLANVTFVYTAGTIVQSGATLQLGLSGTITNLDVSGIVWDNISYIAVSTTNLISPLNSITSTFLNSQTFGGIAGWNCKNIACSVAGTVISLAANTYTITSSMIMTGTSISRIAFTTGSVGVIALVNLQYGATQNNIFVNATRINSLGGQTIYTTGSLATTQNWNTGTQLGESGKFLIMF